MVVFVVLLDRYRYPTIPSPKQTIINLMSYQPQVKGQGQQLKVNQIRNYLTPPYKKNFYGGSEKVEGE